VALWVTASKLTRHETYFAAGFFWTVVSALAAAFAILEAPWYAPAALAGAALVAFAARELRAWKRGLLGGR
jgi:hypothetical protein